MQCPLDDDVALVAKKDKDKAPTPVAHAHVLAGTYPLGVASCRAAQDYEFGLLAEGQNMLSSDEEDEHAPETPDGAGSDGDDEGDSDDNDGDNGGALPALRPPPRRVSAAASPRVLRLVPWRGAALAHSGSAQQLRAAPAGTALADGASCSAPPSPGQSRAAGTAAAAARRAGAALAATGGTLSPSEASSSSSDSKSSSSSGSSSNSDGGGSDDADAEVVVTVDGGDEGGGSSTPGSSRRAREKARREQEKREKREQEKREKRERKEEREKEKRERREEKERARTLAKARAKVRGASALGPTEFYTRASSSESDSDDTATTAATADDGAASRGSARSGAPAMPRSGSLLGAAGADGDTDAAALAEGSVLRDAELQRRGEQYERALRAASHVILYDAQRRRSRRLAHIYAPRAGAGTEGGEEGEGEGEEERVVAVGTRGALDVAAVMRVLFERRDDATRVAIAGGDRYVNDVLRPYLELSLNTPLSAEPVLFFVLPVGKATDVARQIAAHDADYAALFFDDVWTRVFGAGAGAGAALSAEDAAAVRQRIRRYFAAGTRTQCFDIGEVHLTMPDDTSRPLPFIKTVQVSPMGGADEVRDTTVDYYTLRKKGDHEQRHNDKMAMQLLVATRLSCVVRSSFRCDKDALQPTPDTMTTLIMERKRPNRVVQVLTGKIGGGHKRPAPAPHAAADADDAPQSTVLTQSGGAASTTTTADGAPPEGVPSSCPDAKSEHTIVLVSRLLLRSESMPLSSSATSASSSPVSTSASASGSAAAGGARGPFCVLVDGVHYANVKMLSIKSTWRTTRSLRIHSFH